MLRVVKDYALNVPLTYRDDEKHCDYRLEKQTRRKQNFEGEANNMQLNK